MGRTDEFYSASYGAEATEREKIRKRHWFGGYYNDGLPYGAVSWTAQGDGSVSVSDAGGAGGPGGDGGGGGGGGV